MTLPDPFLSTEGIHNFRDFGGWLGADGRQVRTGLLYRSGQHVEASDADLAAIRNWLTERKALLALRDIDDIHRAVDHLNLTAQWAQSRATDDQLDEFTDALLLAMHDLRSVLVRKRADRLTKG